ncbi:MAG: hypothetical protein M1820_000153 [Bogoriella megaspora]|nr:MAG: hypothetical protein M1820_000153 [Bogoriella megaspora]
MRQGLDPAFRWKITSRLFRPKNHLKTPASRLANPINFAPRSQTLPNLPIVHPQLQEQEPPPATEGRDAYPLLTLPEKRRSRVSATGSLNVQLSPTPDSGRSSIGLPRDIRTSTDSRRRNSLPEESLQQQRDQGTEKERQQLPVENDSAESSTSSPPRPKLDKGKGKAIDMPEDTDQPPQPPLESEKPPISEDEAQPLPPQPQPVSLTDPNLESGIGLPHIQTPSRISLPLSRHTSLISHQSHTRSTNPGGLPDPHTSINPDEGYAWGPSHPCFPHPNPHRPLTSPLYSSTRIIRIHRDYTATFSPSSSPSTKEPSTATHPPPSSSSTPVSDRVPAFTNLYPEILSPWVSEPVFRTLISGLNTRLAACFNPLSFTAILDTLLSLLTFWIWEDLGLTFSRRRWTELEKWVEAWNEERRREAKGNGEEDGEGNYARVVPLRRTGLLCLDIEIPEPGIMGVEEEGLGLSEGGDAGRVGEGVRMAMKRSVGDLSAVGVPGR